MADDSVYVRGVEKGAFVDAMEGLPPWATQKTAEDIELHLRKSLKTQNLILAQLVKSASGGGALNLDDVNTELDKLLKNLKAENADEPKKKKRRKEEEEAHNKKKKWWKEMFTLENAMLGAFAGIVTLGNGVRKAFEENIDTFDLLYRSGVDMVSGMDGARNGFEALQQITALTGVRYTELAKTMVQFSTAVNSFGTGKFAKTLAGASAELQRFGYNTKETGELLGAYLEIQRGYADVNSKTQAEVQKDLVKFGERITRLSTATGMARTKLLENLDAISKSTDAMLLSGQIGEAASQKTQEFISSFADKNVGNAFLKMMTAAIKPLNATFMDFQKIGFGGFGQKLMNFTKSLEGLDPEEAKKRMAEFAESNKVEMGRIAQQANLLKDAGVKEAEGALTMVAGIQQSARAYRAVSAEERAKMEETSRSTKALQDAQERFRAQMQMTFAPLPEILDMLTSSLKWINDAFQSVREGVQGFAVWIGLAKDKLDVLPWVGLGVALLATIAGFKAVNFAMNAMIKSIFGKKSAADDYDSGPRNGRNNRSSRRNAAGRSATAPGPKGGMLGKLGEGIGAGIGGLLEGLAKGIGAFANPKILLGASILAGSIAVIGAGIAGATWIIGKALPSFAEGLKAFDGINGGNLIDVAKGVGALGLAMVAFAAGSVTSSFAGVIDTIAGGFSKLFGDGSTLDQLKAFSAIGPGLQAAVGAINNISVSLSNLSATLTSFKGIDNLKAIISTINSLDLLKAAAFAVLGSKSGISLPAPSTPVGVSTPTAPKPSTLNSPSKSSPSEESVPPAKAKEPGKASGPGIEKAKADSGINSMISYQTSLLEQLLQSTNSLVSVNKDILKYTKVHS